MTPEERAEKVCDEIEANELNSTGVIIDRRCRKRITLAIRAAVSEERARYAEVLEKADVLIPLIGLSTVYSTREEFIEFRAARAALKGGGE